MVDLLRLERNAERRGGSSPPVRTNLDLYAQRM